MLSFGALGVALVTLTASTVTHAAPFDILAGAPVNDMSIVASPLPLTTCHPVNISWTGGDAPYRLKIGTGGYYVPNSTWLYEYDNLNATSLEWVVNATAGSSLNFQVYDALNVTKNVQNLVVVAGNLTGNTTSCSACPVDSGNVTYTGNTTFVSSGNFTSCANVTVPVNATDEGFSLTSA